MPDFMDLKKEIEVKTDDTVSTKPNVPLWQVFGGLVAPSLSVYALHAVGILEFIYRSTKESPLLFILPMLFSFVILATIWRREKSVGLVFIGYGVAYVGYSLIDLIRTTSDHWTWNVDQFAIPLLIGLLVNAAWWKNRTRLSAKEFPGILVGFIGFLVVPIGLILKFLIPYEIPDFLIGTPVPMGGVSLLPIGGYIFGLFGGLICYMIFRTKKAAVIGSIIGGLAFNLVITPMPQ